VTVIGYDLGEEVEVRLGVYDVMGRLVRELVGGVRQGAGRYRVVWDGRDGDGREVSAGVYLLRLEAERFVKVRKMVLLR